MKVKKIFYLFESNKMSEKEAYLQLLDMLSFKQNIVLFIFRASSNVSNLLKSLFEKELCKIVFDVTRADCLIVYFKNLESNMQLFELMANMDEQAEYYYLPNCDDFETILFNRMYIEKYNSVRCSLTDYQFVFDQDYGFHLFINESNSNENFYKILDKWECKIKESGKLIKRY